MNIKSIALVIITLIFSASANAVLVSRLGGQAYYDTEADLTWLADANVNGLISWFDANAWAAGLTVDGVGGWRLPDTIDVGNDGATYTNLYEGVDYGYNITTHSELSNMFYNVLGNLAYYDTSGNGAQPGWGLSNTGPFSNLQSGYYWSATEYAPNTGYAWFFGMGNGNQHYNIKTFNDYAWAVQSGDVSAVPVPAAVWLFGSGLIGLLGVARCKKKA
jgi:hypothetical protein